jgi:hypothetical protein
MVVAAVSLKKSRLPDYPEKSNRKWLGAAGPGPFFLDFIVRWRILPAVLPPRPLLQER